MWRRRWETGEVCLQRTHPGSTQDCQPSQKAKRDAGGPLLLGDFGPQPTPLRLVSDFGPSRTIGRSLLFEDTQFVVICYHSPWKINTALRNLPESRGRHWTFHSTWTTWGWNWTHLIFKGEGDSGCHLTLCRNKRRFIFWLKTTPWSFQLSFTNLIITFPYQIGFLIVVSHPLEHVQLNCLASTLGVLWLISCILSF